MSLNYLMKLHKLSFVPMEIKINLCAQSGPSKNFGLSFVFLGRYVEVQEFLLTYLCNSGITKRVILLVLLF